MYKKNILSISFVIAMLFALVGCSNSTESVVEEKEAEIEVLEFVIEEFKESESQLTGQLEESVVMADKAKAEVESLMEVNEELLVSLEESEAKLMAMTEIEVEEDPLPLAISPYPGMSVMVAATNVLDAMRTNDYITLASYVDGTNGVYVAPYQYIDFSVTYNFTPYEIENLATIPTLYPWGPHPASGDMITLNLMDYYNEYIYDEDFYMAPIVGMNIVVSSGNMINNIASSFPTTDTVEFLYPQFDPSYNGLDWSSLTLVFNTDSGMPMLLGIVHGQWTP